MLKLSVSFALSSKKRAPAKSTPSLWSGARSGIGKFSWEKLAGCLRQELEELGGLLRLTELRRTHTLRGDAEELRRVVAGLKRQTKLARASRLRRAKIQQRFLRAHGLPPNASSRRLLHAVPHAAQPLMQALLDEIADVEKRLRHLDYGRT